MEEGWYAKSEYSSKELIEYLENKYPTLEIIGPASRLGVRAEEFGADDFCMTCGAKDKNPTSEGACDECVCIGSGCDSPKSGKSYSYCELCYERKIPKIRIMIKVATILKSLGLNQN